MAMPQRVLISGAFGDAQYRFGFFERIAEHIERAGLQVERFNAFGFNRASGGGARLLERLVTLPGRAIGIDKSRLRAALPWTADGRRERVLLSTVRRFRPDTLIVIRGFPVQPSTLRSARRLGVRECVGWYVEGPLEAGLPERESLPFDRYYCIHTELEPAARARIGWLPSYGLDTRSFSRERWPREVKPRIVFVGTPTPRRVHFLEALRGLPLELWGPKWQQVASLAAWHRGEFIWGPALNTLYNSSAIVLNIASWGNELSGMTQRVVEIPASGAFMLTDAAPEVFDLFAPGREIDVFDSPLTLRRQCERYLADATAREAIADAGHARALRMGDFSHAAAVLLGRAEASPPPIGVGR
jgi:hypothetical protein